MLSDKQLRELRRIGGGPSKAPARPAKAPTAEAPPAPAPAPRAAPRTAPRSLDALTHGRTVESEAGTCYAIDKNLSEFWPEAEAFVQRHLDVVTGRKARTGRSRLDPILQEMTHKPPDGAVYFDIETCGFSGTPVFLIGAMRVRDDRMLLHQFLARDYAEEPAIIQQFAALLDGAHTLVSYNGKSFDWPFVTDRAALHRLSLLAPPHLDLLHQARRSWRKLVPDHKLQTLEIFLCNRRRSGDIPGSEIPAAYHDFVRTGHTGQIQSILQHNLLDLVTMAELVTFLLADEFPTPE